MEFQDLGKDPKLAFLLHRLADQTSVVVNTSRDDFRLTDFKAFLPGSHLLQSQGDPTLQFLQALPPREELDAPENLGREMAESDIRSGTVRVFHTGKPWSQGKPLIDDASGLRVAIAAGCTVGGDTVKLIDAYNARMRAQAAEKQP